jgi:hypothetical protein
MFLQKLQQHRKKKSSFKEISSDCGNKYLLFPPLLPLEMKRTKKENSLGSFSGFKQNKNQSRTNNSLFSTPVVVCL